MEEKIYEVKLLDRDYAIKVICSNLADQIFIENGRFISVNPNCKRVVSLAVILGLVTTSIWVVGGDGFYHNQMDVNITSDNKVHIAKIMPDYSERRVVVDVVT